MVAIYWESAVLLAFRLCCFTLCRLKCLCSSPIWCLGQDVEFDCIVQIIAFSQLMPIVPEGQYEVLIKWVCMKHTFLYTPTFFWDLLFI